MPLEGVYKEAERDIRELLSKTPCGPLLVRLAWHDAGTFDASSGTGGPRGCMRFANGGEALHGANAGLDKARAYLAPVQEKYPGISSADFWALTAIVSVSVMGGPEVVFRPGRVDAASVDDSVPDGRLPDATQGAQHIRDVFYRMGFNDRDIVALSGAHSLGSCHADRSGFEGPWTSKPLEFDNEYFKILLGMKWEPHTNGQGLVQFRDMEGKGLMMLPTDMALVEDPAFKVIVQEFADSEEVFFSAFASAFQTLIEFNVVFE